MTSIEVILYFYQIIFNLSANSNIWHNEKQNRHGSKDSKKEDTDPAFSEKLDLEDNTKVEQGGWLEHSMQKE